MTTAETGWKAAAHRVLYHVVCLILHCVHCSARSSWHVCFVAVNCRSCWYPLLLPLSATVADTVLQTLRYSPLSQRSASFRQAQSLHALSVHQSCCLQVSTKACSNCNPTRQSNLDSKAPKGHHHKAAIEADSSRTARTKGC